MKSGNYTFYGTLKKHYNLHKSPLLEKIIRWLNPVHIFTFPALYCVLHPTKGAHICTLSWHCWLQRVSCMRFVPGTFQTPSRIANHLNGAWYMTVAAPIQHASIGNIPLMKCQCEMRERSCHQVLWCQLAEHCTAQMLPSATPGQHIHQLGTSALGSVLCLPLMPVTERDAHYGTSDILLQRNVIIRHVHTRTTGYRIKQPTIKMRTGRFSCQQKLRLVF